MNIIGVSDSHMAGEKIPHSNFLKKDVIGGRTSPMMNHSILAASAIKK
jgi:hypothetical protein